MASAEDAFERTRFPPVAWSTFALSTVFWHLPKFYELALRSPFWHEAQHASFFWTGILFWWPIIQPTPAKPQWPAWTKIPYLLFADILNTLISAFFVFSGRLLYPSYALARVSNFKPQDDQTVAGLIMWVPGSLIYLLPAFILTMRLLSRPVSRSPCRFPREYAERGRRGSRGVLDGWCRCAVARKFSCCCLR